MSVAGVSTTSAARTEAEALLVAVCFITVHSHGSLVR